MTTIVNSGTGITLSGSTGNPVLVTGTVTAATGAGLYGPGGAATSWTIANGGTITGATYGVSLNASGTITNTGSINGAVGVNVVAGVGTIINTGTIAGSKAAGVMLGSIRTPASAGTIINQSGGLLTGASYGAFVHGFGTVLNLAGGTIASDKLGVGVGFANESGTLSNAGTIVGGPQQDAVLFFGVSNRNRLIAAPSGVFQGKVNGGYGVLELTAGTGTMSGVGSGITNFSTLSFDPGAAWTIGGNAAGLGGFVAIEGFTSGDTISLTSFVAVGGSFASDTLVLHDAVGAQVTLHIDGDFTTGNFAVNSAPSGSTSIALTAPRTFTWTAGSGDWNTPLNWSPASVPSGFDSALINSSGRNIISIGAGESETIDNVTIAAADTLAVSGTLTANRIVDNAVLLFIGSHALDAASLSLAGTLAIQDGSLTLGSSETITQSGAVALLASGSAATDAIINQGSINAAISGGSLSVASSSFINQGTISVVNETMTLGAAGGSWSNSGAITLAGTASLTLAGSVVTAAVGNIIGASSVSLVGTLNNAGATLTAVGHGRPLGTVNLTTTGRVAGGTIADATGTGFAFNGGTFSGVTFQGPINLIANGAVLNVVDGLDPSGTIALTGANARLNFLASQTLDAVNFAIGNPAGADTITAGSSGGTLTLGSHASIVSSAANAAAVLNVSGARCVLAGTIDAVAMGGTFTILGGTFENDGSIIVGNNDRLVVGTGVTGAGTVGLSTGAIADFAGSVAATQRIGFSDATATLALESPSSFGATIEGFATGDTIDLPQIAASVATWQPETGKLLIANGTIPIAALSLAGDYAVGRFIIGSDHTGGTAITLAPLPCFAAGTRILTPLGEVAVENLHEGDRVFTASGAIERICWCGYRDIACRTHADQRRAFPVRIAPHAFGEGRPQRPLLLSPDHAVFAEGVLIPIRFLLNHSTIRQLELDAVSYFHIELAHHDILLADGLPTESYLETGGRSAFANVDPTLQLGPGCVPDIERVAMIWETSACAPLFGGNGEVDRVRRKLAVQARLIEGD